MNDKSPNASSIFIPILFGGFSILGLCLILLVGRINASRAAGQVSVTDTPFRYLLLGTEPGISTPILEEETELPITEPSEGRPPRPSPTSSTSQAPNTPAPVILPTNAVSTNTPIRFSPTPTSTSAAGTFDDTDFRFVYSGNWVSLNNVSGPYQGTLHISNTVGDSVTFSFIGEQILLYYQAGPSLGTVTISIDGFGLVLDQTNASTAIEEWASGLLILGTHTVVVTHTGGGSVNIDAVTIPDMSTATPTLTPTSTP